MESKRSKYTLIGLTIFCILLIGVTSINSSFLAPLRTGVGYVLIPLQSGINKVGLAVYNQLNDYSSLKTAVEENKQLKEQIASLVEDNNRLQTESFELSRLRKLYELDEEYMQYHKVGARVIAKDSGDWFQVFRVDKGSVDGIREDMNVIANGGLVGIVTDVGANYATVRAIIDDASEVGAMAQQSGSTCIVAGDLKLFKEGRLRMTDIAKDGDVKDGDKIITSNISSVFLPGLLVGYASDITVDSNQLTKSGYLIPVAEFDTLQEVLIITDLKEDMTGETEKGTEGQS
ncbi:rod shape-determining protein MreC [Clostridium sp. AM58-1XD]|uniref:rod shape-determining protein MreC n=1 Tax=Clostridium sp. AM58-1XD TaxID=2292307 RepID=UPI000E4A3B69|nr:rod shape-determining protein MreC [Clostridium sp. AM58-1XD]RGZ01478.1 rod shape-determining protein MreC [Clostridium sp. AM58-1XD]